MAAFTDKSGCGNLLRGVCSRGMRVGEVVVWQACCHYSSIQRRPRPAPEICISNGSHQDCAGLVLFLWNTPGNAVFNTLCHWARPWAMSRIPIQQVSMYAALKASSQGGHH